MVMMKMKFKSNSLKNSSQKNFLGVSFWRNQKLNIRNSLFRDKIFMLYIVLCLIIIFYFHNTVSDFNSGFWKCEYSREGYAGDIRDIAVERRGLYHNNTLFRYNQGSNKLTP